MITTIRMRKRTATVVAFIGIGIVVLGGIFWYMHRDNGAASASVFAADPRSAASADGATTTQPNIPPRSTSTPATQEAGQVDGQAMRRYSNKSFHFSLLYPDTLHATEYQEYSGALTVTFDDPNADQQFQIYVVSFGGKQVSDEQFRQDAPSGVRLQPTDVMIGGVHAPMFFSTNALLGDTREVWFIHGGYLYEVTTYKELDTWLADIMKTWKFI